MRLRMVCFLPLLFAVPCLFLGAELSAAEPPRGFVYDWDANQLIYMKGVPHTDDRGNRRMTYDPDRSFLPIIMYHPRLHVDKEGRIPTPFAKLRAGGWNVIQTTERVSPELIKTLKANDLKLIVWFANGEKAKRLAPTGLVFAYDVYDEPAADGRFYDYPRRFTHFDKQYKLIKQYDKTAPILVNNVPWIQPPNLRWWVKWQTISEVAMHDNYPYANKRPLTLVARQGIPASVSLSVAICQETKPSWIIVQSFSGNEARRYLAPTPVELRGMVYAAIIHGSTGINYFAYDNSVMRAANLFGISPEPLESYGKERAKASAKDLKKIKEMWNASVRINKELIDSTPWIFSPTSPIEYRVSYRGKKISDHPIRAILKEYDGQYRLLVVNLDATEFDVQVRFNKKTLGSLQVHYETRSLKVNETKDGFVDHFEPMGTHVYSFKLTNQ